MYIFTYSFHIMEKLYKAAISLLHLLFDILTKDIIVTCNRCVSSKSKLILILQGLPHWILGIFIHIVSLILVMVYFYGLFSHSIYRISNWICIMWLWTLVSCLCFKDLSWHFSICVNRDHFAWKNETLPKNFLVLLDSFKGKKDDGKVLW